VICEFRLIILFLFFSRRRLNNDRTKEFLNKSIQTGGGSKGHSPIEDSVASLDLVKWFVFNKKTKPVMVTVGARARGTGKGGGGGGSDGARAGGAAPSSSKMKM
jgi:hypothetical protein